MAYYGILPSFAGGELSPSMYGRVDTAKYQVGLEKARNCIIHAYGGVSNRPGTEFAAETKFSSKKARLVPFQYSVEQAYILEFGDKYIRFYKDGYRIESSGTPVEVVTTYTEAMLDDLSFVQSADVLFICYPDKPVMMLSRLSHTSWTFASFGAKNGPFMDVNTTETSVTSSGTTGSVTLTASAALFDAKHVGALFRIGGNVSAVTSMGIPNVPAWSASNSYVEGQFCKNDGKIWRALTSVSSGGSAPSEGATWEMTSATDTIEATVFKDWDVETTGFWRGTLYLEYYDEDSASWKLSRTYSSAASTSSNSSGAKNFADGGSVDEPTRFRIRSSSFAQVKPSGGGDVDKGYVSLIASGGEFWGVAVITAVSSSTVATATVLKELPVAAATKLWAEGAWSDLRGYPAACGFFNQRMVFGGTKKQPQTLWFSKPDAYNDFDTTIPAADDDAISITLAADQVNAIRHVVGLGDLIVFTENSEWMVSPGQNAFTPSNAPAKVQSYYGCTKSKPVIVGNIALFVQHKGGCIRNLGFVLESDGYKGTNLSLLATHMFDNHSIVSAALQTEPYGILWCVRNDGKLLGLTYLPEHDVTAWHQHSTDGNFESVACISGSVQDEAYFIVKRTVNGSVKRYVEVLAHRLPDDDLKKGVFLDSSLSYHNSSTAITTVTGLSHLEGKAVGCLADGFVVNGLTVSSGSVTLPKAAKDICIGLPYVSEVKTLRLEISGKDGTMQGRMKAFNRVTLRVEKTLGGKVGLSEDGQLDAPKYRTDEAYGSPVRLRTGDVSVQFPAGYNKNGQIYFVQNEPLPFTILSLLPEVV